MWVEEKVAKYFLTEVAFNLLAKELNLIGSLFDPPFVKPNFIVFYEISN